MSKHLWYYCVTIIVSYFTSISWSDAEQKIAKQPVVAYDNGVEEVQDLSKYLQPDDLLSGKYDYKDPGEYRCARDCVLYPDRRLCYHRFIVEQFHTLGPACDGWEEDKRACYRTQCVCADGFEKLILTINRQLCSPAIMVCYGDLVVIDVINKMPARTTSLHSHGVHLKGYPWMDGASQVTQCPIVEGQTFRYQYPMEQVGDCLFHSHDSIQMMDGLQGPLISRSRKPDPHIDDYDEDLISHTMFIQDWLHFEADNKIPGYNRKLVEEGFDNGKYILINGRGSFIRANGTDTNTPHAVFKVRQGKRYRFRIISTINLPAILTIEDHDFKLISMDVDPIRTVSGSSILLATGERYSMVITTDKEPRSYWIQVKSIYNDAAQYAILRYVDETGSPIVEGSFMPKTDRTLPYATPILNDMTGDCNPANVSAICVDQFEALNPAPLILLQDEPDYRLFITPSFHYFEPEDLYVKGKYYNHYLPNNKGPSLGGLILSDTYNNVSMTLPPFSMLTQTNPFPEEAICDDHCFEVDTFCECAAIYKVPLGAVVEIVIIDETYTGVYYHSHHLHGYSFRVLKQGSPEEMERNPEFYKNLIPPGYRLFPLRDTIVIPHEGYAVIRFWATNPGIWVLHCHITTHNHMGMGTVIQVGERDDFPKPPENFPTCGNFVPNVRFP